MLLWQIGFSLQIDKLTLCKLIISNKNTKKIIFCVNKALKKTLTPQKKSLEKQILSHSGANSKANVYVDREKLLRERQELRAQREKTIEERKKIDLDLKGLNDQVQRKVR